jgi:predicted kinase
MWKPCCVPDFPWCSTSPPTGWTAGAAHVLHHLDVPDAVCKERLHRRNQAGDHAFQASEADFDMFTRYFQPPTAAEGFNIQVHRPQSRG